MLKERTPKNRPIDPRKIPRNYKCYEIKKEKKTNFRTTPAISSQNLYGHGADVSSGSAPYRVGPRINFLKCHRNIIAIDRPFKIGEII